MTHKKAPEPIPCSLVKVASAFQGGSLFTLVLCFDSRILLFHQLLFRSPSKLTISSEIFMINFSLIARRVKDVVGRIAKRSRVLI